MATRAHKTSAKKPGRGSSGRIRLEEIAKSCGVSVSTVSRVLNDRAKKYPIAAATVDLVRERAREMGYRPNRLARAIAYQKTNLIGLSIPHYQTGSQPHAREPLSAESAQIFGLLASGILDCPAMLEYDLVIHDRRKFASDPQFENFESGLLDGLLYCNPAADSLGYIREFARQVPLVMIGFCRDLKGIVASVDIDNKAAARACVRHLVATGKHQPVVIVPENLRRFLCISDRIEGCVEGMREAGITRAKERIVTIGPEEDAVSQWIAAEGGKHPCDAILSLCDKAAVEAVAALHAAGVRIPEEVAVVGFGDGQQCQSSVLPVTSVEIPFYQLGLRSVEILIKTLSGEQVYKPTHHTLPWHLHIRESSACADFGKIAAPEERRSGANRPRRQHR